MNISIVYDSSTGTTAAAAQAMGKTLEEKGAKVIGGFKYRGPEPNNSFKSFVDSLN